VTLPELMQSSQYACRNLPAVFDRDIGLDRVYSSCVVNGKGNRSNASNAKEKSLT
jgi:hypothetical protein